jgi:hypothetical protein
MKKLKRKQIELGYILVFMPDHPRALQGGYKGWVYEHLLVAERKIERPLRRSEEVHHLDLRRANNAPENLLVCSVSTHKQIHAWLDRGAPLRGKRLINSECNQRSSTKLITIRRCAICDFPLFITQDYYCSTACCKFATRRASRPSKRELVRLLRTTSWSALGRKYKVSDNAVRKWARNYGLDPKALR